MQKDPKGMPEGPNRYVYVRNNPVNAVDPWGLNDEDESWGGWLWGKVEAVGGWIKEEAHLAAGTARELGSMAVAGTVETAKNVGEGVYALATSGEARQAFTDNLKDNVVYTQFTHKQEELKNTVNLLMQAGHSPTEAFLLGAAKLTSDVTGATEIYEGVQGEDIDRFVETGNRHELTWLQRAVNLCNGTAKLAGTSAFVGKCMDTVGGVEVSVGGKPQEGAYNRSTPQEPPASTPVGHRGSPLRVVGPTNEPGIVGGRQYSGHAFDKMQSQGLTPTVVENAIETGQVYGGKIADTVIHYDATNNISVVLDKETGRVVTVSSGALKGR